MAQNSELEIRKAVATDAQAVLNLLTILKTESTTFEDSSDDVDSATESEQIERISRSTQQVILLAVLDNELVGLATILPTTDSSTGEIGVAVLKKYWHHGIGRELMLSALDWAALTSHFQIISLTVQLRNQRAVELYESIGFQTTRRTQVTTSIGEVVEASEMQLAVK